MGSKKKSKVWEKNLYELLDIQISATEGEIKKAYRKKALKCHPDKNPDNPKAAELFVELSEALEILTDEKAKEAYDRTLKAKELAKARTRELDAKRRKLKEDLERREKEAKESARARPTFAPNEPSSSEEDEALLRKEVERLKKEGSRALREEQELIRQQILKEQQEKMSMLHINVVDKEDKLKPKFKVKWSQSVIIDEAKLRNLFQKYGDISNIIVIKRSALVEFVGEEAAVKAFETESQKEEYQWRFEWVTKPQKKDKSSDNDNNFVSTSAPKPRPQQPPPQALPIRPRGTTSAASFADFEAMILGKLSDAARTQNSN